MLQKLDILSRGMAMPREFAKVVPPEKFFDIVTSVLRRRLKVVLAIVAGVMALTVLYLAAAEPLYTSQSYVLIDTRRIAGLEDSSADVSNTVDDSTIESQVEVILSEASLLKVVRKLDLVDNETFQPDRPGILGRIYLLAARHLGFGSTEGGKGDAVKKPDAGGNPVPSAFLVERAVLGELIDNSNVKRIGRTYVLSIAYTSPDPDLAASIANAIAEQYLNDQLETKYNAMQRAGDWLQQRIKELRDRSIASDVAVQKFKAENNLVSSGGVLINDQQLSELNTELVKVKSETAQSEARYRRIRNIVDTGAVDAAVTESIDNPVIIDLRTKYLETSRRLEDINHRLGPDSDASQALGRQMGEYKRLIFEELGRIAESYRSDFQIAKDKQTSLERSLADMVDTNTKSNQTQVQLRELERESETYKEIYTTFLQRYQTTLQQQSFPITEARIITAAVRSLQPSSPNLNLTLLIGAVFGIAAAAAVAGLIEYRDRAFRNGTQVRQELGKEFFGMVWSVKSRRLQTGERGRKDASRLLRPSSTIYRHASDNPLTPNAETLRSIKVAADLAFHEQAAKVVGVVSVLPNEGKTTISKNLASLIASSGTRTLLIDCDMRNPSLTRAIAGHAEAGLVEAITEGRNVADLLYRESETGLDVLPCVARKRLFFTSDLLASNGMSEILAWARAHYEYVILDLSPLAPVVDVRVVERQVDGFVFVVKWGETARRTIRSIMSEENAVSEKCLGVVLNQADPKRAHIYQSLDDKERFMSSYTNYYVEKV